MRLHGFGTLSLTPIPPPGSLSRKRFHAISKADWIRIQIKSATRVTDGALFWLVWALAIAQPPPGAAAVLVDEFDAGHFQGTPILAADKWISDLQFFDYLSLLQVFRIENGTSCAHGCRDDQSIID